MGQAGHLLGGRVDAVLVGDDVVGSLDGVGGVILWEELKLLGWLALQDCCRDLGATFDAFMRPMVCPDPACAWSLPLLMFLIMCLKNDDTGRRSTGSCWPPSVQSMASSRRRLEPFFVWLQMSMCRYEAFRWHSLCA